MALCRIPQQPTAEFSGAVADGRRELELDTYSSRRSVAIPTLGLSVKIHAEENAQLVVNSAIRALIISNLRVRGRTRMSPA